MKKDLFFSAAFIAIITLLFLVSPVLSSNVLQPQQGGTLRIITDRFPTVFGNPKEYSGSNGPMRECLESLTTLDEQGNLVPNLATSYDVDTAKKIITLHLRKAVKFHDGTDFNAAAVKWNFEQYLEANKINGGRFIKSIETTDDFTLKLYLSQYSPVFLGSYTFSPSIFSPTAVQTMGLEKSRTRPVGTGPYKFSGYVRDSYVKFERFDGYWQGRPPLDGIEFRFIPDPMAAAASMQSGEADAWFTNTGLPLKETRDLLQKGYKTNYFQAWFGCLIPDSANLDSSYSKKGVREAVEYAIDKAAIAKTLGYGFMEPLTQLAFSTSLGYNKNDKGRLYNPAKAKQLLSEAGYANGFKTKITVLASSFYRDIAVAIQGYLAAVGIDAQLDVADTARFNTLTQSTGGKSTWNNGLILVNLPVDPGMSFIPQFLRVFAAGARYPSLARSPEFNKIVDTINSTDSDRELVKLCQQMVAQASNDQLVVPVLALPDHILYQKYVHASYFTIPSPGVWPAYKDWMEK